MAAAVLLGVLLGSDKVHILYIDLGIIAFAGLGFFTALFEASKIIPRNMTS